MTQLLWVCTGTCMLLAMYRDKPFRSDTCLVLIWNHISQTCVQILAPIANQPHLTQADWPGHRSGA